MSQQTTENKKNNSNSNTLNNSMLGAEPSTKPILTEPQKEHKERLSTMDAIKIINHNGIFEFNFDLPGEKANKLSSPVMLELEQKLTDLKNNKEVRALIFSSSKSTIFIAGADINEIKDLKEEAQVEEAVKRGQDIFNLIEDLPFPTIAIINGACMGGGTEMVLACDYRILSRDKSSVMALPEVKLGILPGFGGCIRLPRLVGLPSSLDIILSGKNIRSRKAKKIGLVDEVMPKELMLTKAKVVAEKLIKDHKKNGKKLRKYKAKGAANKFMHSAVGKGVVFSKAKKSLLKLSKGHYPAPLQALEVVKKTYGMGNRNKALKIEREAFKKVATTDISKNLINLFFSMEDIKKSNGTTKDIKGSPVGSLNVIGAGTMGGGIAQLAADKGVNARMKDINNESLARGFSEAAKIWLKKVKRRHLSKSEFQAKMGLLTGTLDYSGFKNVDVVIEAIVEDMKIKKSVLSETAKHCKEDCIFATNTSSLSVTEMSGAVPKPENFVGFHFFNPVNKMPLVEIIRGPQTSDQTVATVYEFAKKMGKTPVVVKDGPGFLVNRLLLPWLSEGLFILEDGYKIEEVDRAFTHEFGMPMGPFRLMDEIGLDVCMKVLKVFKEAFGERMQISSLVAKMSDSSRLGKKGGKGFYLYDSKGKPTGVDKEIYSELGLGQGSKKIETEKVINRGVFAMVNEASVAFVKDRIVESANDVDLGMIMGTGFPPFRGGLLKYADTYGVEKIVSELEVLRAEYGTRFSPAPELVQVSQVGGFYKFN